ncbi:Bacterial alpha-L-rhamnosidase [Maribellus comscasis]|uniref:alpha-L-rhamnosidase n=1 Tax=Maribellus comscasis TaxID=2681766 RepID=A0A6I6K5J4_9BACT|nr:alpha-L-rhamnosidase C-terminal domain-containing protein [Maribellus comscasis]QGY45274.1 Bacterial alpha-L-rhamnosidase [Maribellus comscasis]
MKNFILIAFIFVCFSTFGQDSYEPTGLLTELLRAPEIAVITDSEPEFGWIFPQQGVSQTACQILVASSPGLLQEDKADLWDSGKMQSANSQNISYRGKKLQPNTSYWWKVKVWGENSYESKYSQAQKFITGDLNQNKEWPGQSKWVQFEEEKWVAEDRQMASFFSLLPVTFEKSSANSWFADFGKAAFATLDIRVTAKKEGERLIIFLGERKNFDFTVNKNPGVSNIGFYKYETVLKKGTHNYQVEIPRHDARYPHSQKLAPFYPEVLPFRYVEINGTENMEVNSVVQKALFYYFDDEASHFESPDNNLNKVWDLCKYTLKATPFLGVYCDGNRERMPYEADAYIQQLGHYSVDREYSAAQYTAAFLIAHASWPTEWQMHSVMMAREHYMYTGDTEFLATVYDDLKKKTLIDLAREDGLISTRTGKVTPEFLKSIHYTGEGFRDIVDWPAGTPVGKKQASNAGPTPEGERDGYVFTDYNTVVNAFHFYALNCMSEIAGALEKKEDADFFKTQAKKVQASIMKNMFNKENGIFTDGIGTDHSSLHANMLPLAFNLVPQENIKSVAEFLKTKGMACSVYGAQYLLEALYNAGEAEYALDLITSESKRSWINMLNVGSTMTTEAWDEYYKPNLTWNHAWGAAPGNIIPRRLLGIQPLDPGFKTFTVNPQPTGLEELEIRVPTIRGGIECSLNSNAGLWEMDLSVPGNSEAFVLIPSELNNILVNGENHTPASQIHYLGMSRNLLQLKGGNYRISAKK